ncbi:hypothetical protein BU17DRAFT_55167, partial [Hysterangium stoloniferum]
RFIDAYSKGLNGAQAVWANRKYHGHQVLLDNILRMFEEGQSWFFFLILENVCHIS